MKRLAMLAAIGLVAFPALAAGQYGPRTKWFDDVTLTTAATGIGRSDSLSMAQLFHPFTIVPPSATVGGYMLSVSYTDTIASAAAVDSVYFVLLYRPSDWTATMETMANAAVTSYPKGYTAVYTFPVKICNATAFPVYKFIPRDSLVVYPMVPGSYRWAVRGGAAAAAHVMDKAQKFRCQIEAW